MVVVFLSYILDFWMLTNQDVLFITKTGRSVALALAGLVLTGLVILISLSGERFLSFLQKNDSYDKLFFLFEYNIAIALLTVLISMAIGVFGITNLRLHVFLFFLFHLILNFARLISGIITFGEKKGEFEAIDDLDGEQLRENAEIPNHLLRDEFKEEEESEEESD
ncbi:hypothetical protein [Haloarcula sp. JP-L23]|uniref:hypothetical protein n=1 Tax=Haloarcula sp. JP-L23 TaxID=2716717 RepID=UPI00140F041B|nr:hypothetical protein G9465_02855 [Haloarcula sp. JP-L23]